MRVAVVDCVGWVLFVQGSHEMNEDWRTSSVSCFDCCLYHFDLFPPSIARRVPGDLRVVLVLIKYSYEWNRLLFVASVSNKSAKFIWIFNSLLSE